MGSGNRFSALFHRLERRFLPAYAWQSDPLTFWRERILFILCFTAAALGPIALVPSLLLAFHEGLWDVIALDAFAYGTAVGILLARRYSLRSRALAACLMLYFLGVGLVFMLGPVGAGYIWLFGAAVMAGAIIGLREAVWVLVLNLIALLAVAVYMAVGSPFWAGVLENPLEKWLVMAANFLLLNALVTFTTAVMLTGLKQALAGEQEAGDRFRRSEERLHAILEANPDPVVVYDVEGHPQYLNPAFSRVFGWSLEDLTGRHIPFVPEDQTAVTDDMVEEVYRLGHPFSMETQRLTREGALLDVILSAACVRSGTGETIGLVANLTDITERKRLEAQLQQALKMEAVGRLAGGVAHDLNNLLSPVIGYAELLLETFSKEDGPRRSVQEIMEAGYRARDLVRQLLAFSRRQTLEFRTLDLAAVVAGFENLLRRTIREDIEIRILSGPGLRPIRADPGQMEQVIMNLAVNAQDAMAEGGLLTIETANADSSPEGKDRQPCEGSEQAVVLVVRDTGHGMDAETRSHVFEPFFTTKAKGKGTGLGLSTVYGIVKQHGGSIRVESEPDRGTSVLCRFPAVEAPAEPVDRKEEVPQGMRGTETVVVAEDDLRVCNLAVSVLRRQGYTVHATTSGRDCLRLLDEARQEFHLLLTDVVMPEMDGKDLYRRAVKLHPDLKVLYMSGYTDEVIAHHGVLEPGIDFIQKPFSVRDLAVKVREVLDRV